MTTREAISGRMIAAAGMKDGAAMKALALLTTVFLPGTFRAVRGLNSSHCQILHGLMTLADTVCDADD
jgi:hypothetical protein